jgi:hypothetical protein
MFATQDVNVISQSFYSMVGAVEKCASSFRVFVSTSCEKDLKGTPIVNSWIDGERESDEKLLELLHNTYLQIMSKKA